MEKLVGRRHEIGTLKELLKSNEAELITIYDRRKMVKHFSPLDLYRTSRKYDPKSIAGASSAIFLLLKNTLFNQVLDAPKHGIGEVLVMRPGIKSRSRKNSATNPSLQATFII